MTTLSNVAAASDTPANFSERSPSTPTEEFPSAATAWSLVAILFCLSIISVLDRNVLTLLVEPVKRHLGISEIQMSLLLGAAFAVPFGVLSIPVGWAVDRFPRRYIIAAGITTWSIATIATGLVRSYDALFVARSCVGAGDATLAPSNSSLISDLFPRDKLALPMAIASMGFKAGQGAALLIGAALMLRIAPEAAYDLPILGELQGWQVIFVAVGLPGLLFVPAIFLIREPARRTTLEPGAGNSASFSGYFRFMRHNWRLFLPHHLGVLLLIALSYTVIAWMPAFLTRVYGWSESTAGGWLGTAFLAAPLLGMPLHGALADHLFRRGWRDIHMRYPMLATTLGAPLAISAFLVPHPETAVVLAGLFIFVVSGYVSLPITALMSVLPNHFRGKAAAIVGLVCATSGTVLGPLAVGTVTDVIYGDPRLVGHSIITCIAVLAPLVIGLFALTLAPLRGLAAAVDAQTHDGHATSGVEQ